MTNRDKSAINPKKDSLIEGIKTFSLSSFYNQELSKNNIDSHSSIPSELHKNSIGWCQRSLLYVDASLICPARRKAYPGVEELPGLHTRRDKEAQMIANARTDYHSSELISI